jgi:DNA-binding transcriptional MerR regulator
MLNGEDKINMANDLITISEIVSQYGVPYSTVNHYTSIGLLTVVSKRRNVRLYNEPEVKKRLKRISELKDKGYPLHLIQKELLK